jgi:hypothetical protein
MFLFKSSSSIHSLEKKLCELSLLMRKFSATDDEVASLILKAWLNIAELTIDSFDTETHSDSSNDTKHSSKSCPDTRTSAETTASETTTTEVGTINRLHSAFAQLLENGVRIPNDISESRWRSDIERLYELAIPLENKPPGDPIPPIRLYAHLNILENACLVVKNKQVAFRLRQKLSRLSLCLVLIVPALLAFILQADKPWKASYFANADLRGTPELVRPITDLDFDIETHSGSPGLRWENYSVSYTTNLLLPEDLLLVFTLSSDDGSRLIVDGEVLIDQWKPQVKTEVSTELKLSKGSHNIRVDYFQWVNSASLRLEIEVATERGILVELPAHYLEYPDEPK